MTDTIVFDRAFFAQYTSAQMRALAPAAQLEVRRRLPEDIAEARAKMEVIAREIEMPLDELIGKPKAAKAKVAQRYQNPANPAQQWTGRGRQPQWVTDALASGKTKESLEISAQ